MFGKQAVCMLAVATSIIAAYSMVQGGQGLEHLAAAGDAPLLPKGAISRLGKIQNQRSNLGSLSVTFLSNGTTLASTGPDGKLVFWNVKTGKAIRILDGHPVVAFSSDGEIMASHRGGKSDQSIRVWQVDSGKEIASLRPIPHYVSFREFCFSKDGRYLFVGGGTENNGKDDPTLCAWDVAQSKKATEFPLRQIVQCIMVSPDGKRLATSTYGRHKLQIWDITNHKETRCTFSDDARTPISGIAFSPDNCCLACVGHIPAVRLLHVETGKVRWRILTLDDWALCVAFSPMGRMLAVGTGKPQGNVYLIEAATGMIRTRLSYGDKNLGVLSVAFSPDGLLLASAASDCAPLLWDVRGRILDKAAIKPLDSKDLEKCWRDLSSGDGAMAWQAILALEARPQQTLPLFREVLVPNPKLDGKRLAQLQNDLNDDSFQVRERATKQFEVLGQAAGPPLHKILATVPPVEVRKRVEKLLAKIGKGGLLSEELRSMRAHEILESMGSPEARRLLAAAAAGEPTARVTQDARASLERMQLQHK